MDWNKFKDALIYAGVSMLYVILLLISKLFTCIGKGIGKIMETIAKKIMSSNFEKYCTKQTVK